MNIFDIFAIFLRYFSAKFSTSDQSSKTPGSFTVTLNCLTILKMDATPLRLTFGVELEFIVLYDPEVYQDALLDARGTIWPAPTLHHKFGVLVRKHMIRLLNENGFPTNEYPDVDFSKWTVATDGTVAPVDKSANWYAIELKTPVLDISRQALKQVEKVVELLVSRFKLYVNESCGLHVHVGNEDRGFPLRTIKNFCSLISIFEHQLDSLHSPDRLKSPYAKATRTVYSSVATATDKLLLIDSLDSVDNVIAWFHPINSDDESCGDGDKYMAFNFFNLHSSLPEPLRTIEYRQHRGTLDPELITNWIMVATNLVSMSHTDSKGFFRQLIELEKHNANYTVLDLFNDLRLSDLAEFYAPRVFPQYGTDQNPAPKDESMDDDAPKFIDISSPDQYDTPWEKKFAPRPPFELRPYKHSLDPDTHGYYSENPFAERRFSPIPAEDMRDRPS